jgi:hypothetical protein
MACLILLVLRFIGFCASSVARRIRGGGR